MLRSAPRDITAHVGCSKQHPENAGYIEGYSVLFILENRYALLMRMTNALLDSGDFKGHSLLTLVPPGNHIYALAEASLGNVWPLSE